MSGKGEKKKGVEERLRVKTVGAHIESGCQKRAKRDKHDQFVKTLPKLTKFYSRPTSSTPTPEPIASSSTSNARDSEKSADDIDLSMSPIVDSDNGADSDDSSDNTMSLSSVYSNASRPCSTLVNVSDSECALVNLDCNQSSDPGLWLLPFSFELVDFWIEKGPIACQNNDGAFLKSKRVYNAKGKKFCKGFADWKHASTMLGCHEKSAHHVKCIRTYIERNSLSRVRRVDCELVKQYEKKRNYWIQVLERIVATIKFLANRGLGFRGDDEIIGSTRNGNYLGTLELIAQFDPFLNEHIKKYGNAGRWIPSYLSSTICNEFIDVMGQKVLKIIVAEIQESKYFSISVDSTPDVTHVDQLTFTFRYVKQD